MKKIIVFAAMAIAATAFVSCEKKVEDKSINATIDSLSYAFGHDQAQQTKQRLAMMDIDTAYMAEFIKGLREGSKAVDDKKKQAYNAGVAFGLDMMFTHKGLSRRLFGSDSTKMLSMTQMVKGYEDALKGKPNIVEPEALNDMAGRIFAKAYEKNIEKSEKFMKDNAKKPGVKTLDGGVQYKVIKTGTGAIPTDTSFVKLHYEGRTIDGKVFDSSYKREPIVQQPVQFIPGFAEALVHMPVGSTWEVYIPQEKAYGQRGMSDEIQPYSALIFKVEVLGIEKNAPKPTMPAGL